MDENSLVSILAHNWLATQQLDITQLVSHQLVSFDAVLADILNQRCHFGIGTLHFFAFEPKQIQQQLSYTALPPHKSAAVIFASPSLPSELREALKQAWLKAIPRKVEGIPENTPYYTTPIAATDAAMDALLKTHTEFIQAVTIMMEDLPKEALIFDSQTSHTRQ